MSRKFPLQLRQNYTIKERPRGWSLVCDHCNSAAFLSKPIKDISPQSMQALIQHTYAHAPISQPSLPEEKAYAVAQVGEEYVATKVEEIEEEVGIVQQVEKGVFLVYVLAANIKHAKLIAGRVIKRHIQSILAWPRRDASKYHP